MPSSLARLARSTADQSVCAWLPLLVPPGEDAFAVAGMIWLARGGARVEVLYGGSGSGKVAPSCTTVVLIDAGRTRIMFSPLALKICSRSWPGRPASCHHGAP